MQNVKRIIVVLLVPVAWSSSFGQFTHNIKVVEITTPAPSSRIPVSWLTPIRAQFQNSGTADETNVRLIATVTQNGTTFYRDTQLVVSWESGVYHVIAFRDFQAPIKLPH